MSRNPTPCLNCEKRHFKCHKDCEAYKKYAERLVEERAAKAKRVQEQNDWFNTRHEHVREIARRNTPARKRKKT